MTDGRCFPALLLLTALTHVDVASAWEPYNLTATVSPESDGFNSIEVAWTPGACASFDESTVSIIRGTEVRTQTVRTARGLATFSGCEYWTRYEVVLQTGLVCGREELHAFVKTGPGPPHKPKELKITPEALSANFSILESYMPRAISGYILQLCKAEINGGKECKTQHFMNHTAADGLQNGTIRDLAPDSTYEYRLTAVILDGLRSYMSEALLGSFNTLKSAYPKAIHARVFFEEDIDSKLSASFTWKTSDSIHPVEFFSASVEPCHSECTLDELFRPEANFTNLKFSESTTLKVTAHITVSGKLVRTRSAFKFRMPKYVRPIEALQEAPISPTEFYFGWEPTSVSSVYDVVICHSGNCSMRREGETDCEVHLTNQEPGAIYDVDIFVRQQNFSAHYFKGSIRMLEKDYGSPVLESVYPVHKYRNKVVYGMNVTVASNVSSLEVEACSSEGISRSCHRLSVENISDAALELEYFRNYDLEVWARYDLPLNKTVRRGVRKNFDTIGTVPDAVDGIIFAYVSSNATEIQFNAPRNVPLPVKDRLDVSYEISDQSKRLWTTNNTHLKVENLHPFTEYKFTVTAVVEYLKVALVGKAASKVIKTDAWKPGKVGNLTVTQQPDSATVGVEWTAPETANGPLNFYDLEYRPSNSTAVAEKIRVNGTQVHLRLPVSPDDVVYWFQVTAGNIAVNGRELPGESAATIEAINGMGLRFTVSVEGRTAHSLQLSFNWTVDPKRALSRPEFKIIDRQNRTTTTKLRIATIGNLETYQNETLRIRGCFAADYCSEETVLVALTDVGAPSAVLDLHADLFRDTNLAIYWREPETKNGPIYAYIVQIIDETDLSVKRNFTLKNNTNLFFINADEFETYLITVRAVNAHVDEPEELVYGPAVSVEKRTSGRSVPKPENLRVVETSSTAVTIEFGAPADPGKYNVTSYIVEAFEPALPNFQTKELSARITGFKPFQQFTIGVKSCTGGLVQPECGLPRRIYGRTDSAAPSKPQNLNVEILDDYDAMISWQAPAELNGELGGYNLTIKGSNEPSSKYLSNETLRYKAVDLKPNVMWTITLSAFTFDQHRKQLDSEPFRLEFSTGHSSQLLLGLLLFFAAMVFGGVMFAGFAYLRRRRARLYGQRLRPDEVET